MLLLRKISGLTCRSFIKIKQIIFILGKNIGPAAAGPAGPVPAHLYCIPTTEHDRLSCNYVDCTLLLCVKGVYTIFQQKILIFVVV